MSVNPVNKNQLLRYLKNLFFISLLVTSCTIPKKYQKGKPFITKNSIEVKGGNFNKEERVTLKQRLNAQLDDSSRVTIVDKYFIRHVIVSPPAYDSASAGQSARNMESSMRHLGYYNSRAEFHADTQLVNDQQRVYVQYKVQTGKPTLIDSISYILRRPDLQLLAMQNIKESLLKKGEPVTKVAVLGEITRLVNLYRNNGYYKFSSEQLVMMGDTTVAALTTVTDNIFDQLNLLSQAQFARDSPTIKLAVVLNPPADSSKLKQYYIDNIYVLPDYRTGDRLTDSALTTVMVKKRGCDTCRANFIVKFHKKLFRTGFLRRNLYVRRGDLYSQENFYKTLGSFSKIGVWQSVNIQIVEQKSTDSIGKIDLIVQLVPGKRYGYETSIEASYSASSNTNNVTAANAGNLLGLSGNVSVLDRNLRKEAISMTNAVHGGIEFNFKPDSSDRKNFISSNEVSYSNNLVFPRFIFPFLKLNSDKRFSNNESFINTKLSYINRINLFNLQSFNFAVGYDWDTKYDPIQKKYNRHWVFKPFNVEFARLYNETDSFRKTLEENPFLRYSFNTSLVAGASLGYRALKINSHHPNRQHTLKVNAEISGIPWYSLGILKKYMRQFGKADVEYIYSASRFKSAFVFRMFGGIGIAARRDTTLPFFKQYFGGGSNSMRGWPVRGIGRGSQPLTPFGQNKFNDRTGDIQLESNIEYRYTILQIIPNSLILRGALFLDIGNVWNLRNSKPGGGIDSAQFKFANLYRDLGVAAGTGFRLDFNYVVLRFDFGFRIKRPDISANSGWQLPGVSFNNLFKKGVLVPDLNNPGQSYNDNRYKKWRYENFNLTIGISYPF